MRGLRLADGAVCPDMDACRAHIERIAPWDMRLYNHVRQAFSARISAAGEPFRLRLANFRADRASARLGVCETSADATPARRCCCADRMPCFNMTGRERRYREPAACVPGPRRVHELVASDMPLGWCCTWAAWRQPQRAQRRRARESQRKRAKRGG